MEIFHRLPVWMKVHPVLHFVDVQVLVKTSSEVGNSNSNQKKNDFGCQAAKFFDDENYLPYSSVAFLSAGKHVVV